MGRGWRPVWSACRSRVGWVKTWCSAAPATSLSTVATAMMSPCSAPATTRSSVIRGDDDDTIEGQDGFDRMLFNGSNISENIDVAANGPRVRFFRDIANVTMDLDDVERIDFNARGGADSVVVNGDLSGTDLVEMNT